MLELAIISFVIVAFAVVSPFLAFRAIKQTRELRRDLDSLKESHALLSDHVGSLQARSNALKNRLDDTIEALRSAEDRDAGYAMGEDNMPSLPQDADAAGPARETGSEEGMSGPDGVISLPDMPEAARAPEQATAATAEGLASAKIASEESNLRPATPPTKPVPCQDR